MAGKKIIKAHRGFAHVPRGRRGFGGDPRRNPQLPRRLPRNFNQMSPRARMQFMMENSMRTGRPQSDPFRPSMRTRVDPRVRRQMEAARRRFNQQLQQRRRKRRPTGTPIPQQRQDRARMLPPSRANLENIKQTQQLRQAQPVGRPQQVREAQPVGVPQEVRQAQQEPMQRPTGRRVAAKGKFITKKNIGANDYRQGGMVLNSVDNRKNKK